MSYKREVTIDFRSYKCYKCNTKLNKEKTYRVININDYEFSLRRYRHKYPKVPVEVIDYRYICPNCKMVYSNNDIKLYKLLLKNNKYISFTKEEYMYGLDLLIKNNRRRNWIIKIFFLILAFVILIFTSVNENLSNISIDLLIENLPVYLIILLIYIFLVLRKSKVEKANFDYQEVIYQHIACEAINNYDKVINSNKCYCYKCLNEFSSNDIISFEDNTAICPHCNNKTIVPDNALVDINIDVLNKTNEYWF